MKVTLFPHDLREEHRYAGNTATFDMFSRDAQIAIIAALRARFYFSGGSKIIEAPKAAAEQEVSDPPILELPNQEPPELFGLATPVGHTIVEEMRQAVAESPPVVLPDPPPPEAPVKKGEPATSLLLEQVLSEDPDKPSR